MLAASSSTLAKRSGLIARASFAASRLGLSSSTTAFDCSGSRESGADERTFSSMGSSTSTAAAATSTSSFSPLLSSSGRSRDSTLISRGFSSSAFASSSGRDDGEGGAPTTSTATNDDDDSGWSNPMPSLEAIDDFLDEWGRLIDEGDAEGVLRLLEEKTEGVPGLPPLSEVWASATAADDERAARRAHETAAQLEAASRRQRLVDEQGRSYATGRRKEAVARVWLRPASGRPRAAGGEAKDETKAVGRVWINGAPLDAYFPSAPTSRAADVLAPFVVTRTVGEFDVRATVKGGGPTGQAQAVRHGVARALQLWSPDARPALKAAGLLTRDSRSVERKKPGRAKARKAFQWVKR